MAEAWTVVVVGRAPEKMRAASRVLEAGFDMVGVFAEADAERAIADSGSLLAVVVGGSVSTDARERLRTAAASRGAVTIDAAIGHDDPAEHFRSEVLPHLIAARTARRTAL